MSYLSRPRGYLLLAVLIMATALAGCMNPSTLPAPAPSLPQADGEVVTMHVGPTQADCVGEGPMKCLLVKEGDAEGPYLMFYSNIKGFDYEEGYHYELLVRKTKVENPPAGGSSIAFELVEVVNKTLAGEVSTLYVAPMMVECETTEIYKCLLVADSPDGEYRPFYGKISGFDYEEGYQYTLLVEEMAMDQPPSDAPAGVWNLLAVTRKEPAAAVAAAPQQTALEGTLWMLISYAGADGQMQPILTGSEVTATFQGGRVVGNAGCNNYTGSYILDGNALVIGPVATTMMACISAELTAQETAYLAALSEVAEYQVADEALTLLDGDGAKILEYAAAMPVTLTGTTWEVTMVNNGKEAVVSVAADTTLTMTFDEEGQVSGSAGCNNFTGGYTVDGDAITIGPLASTMMMCAEPETVMEQEAQFLAALSTAVTYTIHGDKLELRTATGALAVSATAQAAETAEAPAASTAAPLEGTLWMLTSYTDADGQTQPALADSEVSATFQDGRVAGNAGCNNYTASYTLDGNALTIGPAATTMMACISEDLSAQEAAYLSALSQVAAYQISGETLSLTNAAGATILEYVATMPVTLTGTTWLVTSYNNGNQGVVSVAAGTELTIIFTEDGQVSGSAGCNNFAGGYTVDGDAITVGPLASTMMMCVEPETVMEQEAQFLAALQAATVFTIQGNDLEMRDDSGALQVMANAQLATAEATAESGPTPLEGTLWTLTSYLDAQGESVAPIGGAEPTATFMDGRVSGNASCNMYNAGYTVDGNSMQISLGISTMMMCQPEAVAAQEQAYLAALATVAAYQIEGDTLTLMNEAGETVLVFAATEPVSLTGTTWLVTSYNNGKEAVVSIAAGTELTMIFTEDGQVSGSAGCNNFTGGYTVDGDAITVGSLASTMMMCVEPEIVMEQEAQFLAALQAATVFSIQSDEIELRDGTGALQVSAAAQPAEVAQAAPLEGTLWTLTTYLDAQGESVAPIEGAEPTAIFADGRVSGNASCNSYGAEYTVDGNSMQIGLAISTMMMCQPEAVAAQEQAYLAALARVATFEIVGDTLTLADSEGNVVLSYVAQQPTSLTGTDWQVSFYNNGKEALVSPIAGSVITMLFGDDGNVSGSASCNNFSGEYMVDGDQMTIGPLATTRRMCIEPEGAMEQEAAFLAALQSTATYQITDDTLELLNADGARAVSASAAIPALTAGGNPEDVLGKTWLWQNTVSADQGEIAPTDPAAFTLELLPDGAALVRSDCNSVAGSFTMAEDDGLTLDLPTEGLSNCGEQSFSPAFLADLSRVAVFSLADGALILELDAGAGNMVFGEVGAATAAQSDVVALPTEQTLLVGPVWTWQSLDMSDGSITVVKNPEQYTIEFMDDGTLNVQADCNKAGGAYTEDNGALTIEVAAITRMACPPDSLSDIFIGRLNEVATYVMDGGKLYLNLKMDSGNLVFAPLAAAEERAAVATPAPALIAPVSSAPIIGPTWQWARFQDATEGYTVAQPERYTVAFRADGEYEVQADCNTGVGSFTLDGKNISIGPAALTRMACPPDSQADAFLKHLDAAMSQFVVGKNLYITTKDGGVMKLVRAR